MSPKQMVLDYVFLRIAREFAQLSHCQSWQVGCVIVKDGRILTSGYNGSPSGLPNCDSIFPPRAHKDFNREEHHKWSNIYEVHAELNALAYAARHGISIEGATLYSTLQPCIQCTKNLIPAGIKRVVYCDVYDKNDTANDDLAKLLELSGVSVSRLELIDG